MINISFTDIATEQKPLLRKIAAFLIDLADTDAPVALEDKSEIEKDTLAFVEKAQARKKPEPMFTPEELAVSFPEPVFQGNVPPPPPPINAPSTAVAVPSSTAPEAFAAFSAQQTSGTELDAQGVPWDARIHARTKSKTASGEWKLARNVDPNVAARVIRDHKKNNAVAPAAPPSAPIIPVPPPIHNLAESFISLMPKITAAISEKRLTREHVLAAIRAVGLTALPELQGRPDLIPGVAQRLGL